MISYALTGGIASGKSSACTLFEKLGAHIISSDKIVHSLFSKHEHVYQEIIKHFGEIVLNKKDQSLDRAKLKKIIFTNLEQKQWLESLIHPAVRMKIQQLIQKPKHESYTIVEIPLLKSKKDFSYLTGIIFIECDKSLQISRAINRDKTPIKLVDAIIESQDFLCETKLVSDFIINNNKSHKNLKKEVTRVHNCILKKFQSLGKNC